MTGFQYVLLGLDALVISVLFYKVFKNVQTLRLNGLFKVLMITLIIWIGSKFIGLDMVTQVFGTIISYSFLAVIILFPDEIRRLMDQFGRRGVFKRNKDKLLNKQGRKALADAVLQLSRKKEGAYIVIAREDTLEEEIGRGERLGELEVTSDMLQLLFQEGGAYSKGAVIIKDNAIVSANSMLDIAKRDDLIRSGAGKRHLSALHVTYAKDCVAVVVSARTGKITIAGKTGKKLEYMYAMPTKQMDIHDGLDEFEIEHLIEGLLENKKASDEDIEEKRKKANGERKVSKEERQEQLRKKKEQKEKERHQKREELEKRKKAGEKRGSKKGKQEDPPVSKGFGGYDIDDFR